MSTVARLLADARDDDRRTKFIVAAGAKEQYGTAPSLLPAIPAGEFAEPGLVRRLRERAC